MTRLLATALGALLVAGCGAAAPEAAPRGTAPPTATAGGTTTWPDGTLLKGTVTVPAGSTVQLVPGATVRAAKGASLVVAGTLLAPAGAHLTGTSWKGITVARGGSAALTRVDLTGGGLATESGAGTTSLTDSTLSQAETPLSVGEGTTLRLAGVRVRKPSGASVVAGSLVADRLSYDKAGSPGMVITGSLRLTHSVLYGNGRFEGDMLTTSKAKEITVSDTEIRDVHCAFHLVGVGRLALDRLSIHDNAYGFMAYGSDPSVVHRITDSDVYDNRDFGLAETPGITQGRIVVDGGYWADNGSTALASLTQVTGKVERTNPATAHR